MFRNNERKEVFGLRKYKGYGLASAMIGVLMFGASGVAHANVIENNDGTTTLGNGKVSITLESSHVKESDKTADELYKAGEYGPEKVKSGVDEVTLKKTVDVKFVTEDGKEIDKSISNDTEKKVSETYEVTGKSGKKYKGDDNVAIDVDPTTGKKDVITKDGKTYKYVRSEVEKTGDVSAKDAVTFNDVKTHAIVQGMYKADGGINYDKITSRVWLVEEKEDGTYGKFKLIENGAGLTDEKVAELSKEATGTLSAAEVEKLGGMKDTDTVLVYEMNTYAAVKKEKHAVHDLVMTWGYSGGYSNAVDGGLSTDIPGVTKDDAGNYYYKGVKLVDYLKDTDKMMSDSTELDIYKDILEGKNESLLKYIGYFGNAPEVYRDHLFSRWMLARNMELVKKIENGDYRDSGLSETIKVIEPKVTVEETPEKTITRTVRYELKEVPKDKDGLVPVGGKVVTYYYVEKVDVKEVLKQALVTVHYYKDGTTEKLADSIEKGKQDIGSKYVTEAPRTIEEKLSDGSVRKWLLKAVPFNANGDVKAGGTTVIYYYMEFSIPKDAPVVELPEYNPSKEEPKVEIPKVQPNPLEIPKPTPVEVVKEEPKVIPAVKTAEPVVQQKVLPNTGSDTTNTAGLGLGVIAVGVVMVKQRRKLGKRQ